ncbi:uncharacterized protein LOC122507968 [Leptopilina heterotoma]|uniref:uncharacterized protein LOC122507968 n=1 Tax=Leptopilina heterotoma TaxID=63436 RepID=UPI001CA89850|nr:uncharacterized protein LOC122507968 [Leptopilina heterotoma]
MPFFKKVILLFVSINFCFADDELPLSVEDHNTTTVMPSGRQLGVISFLQKLIPTQDPKTYISLPFNQRCPLCDSSVYSYCGERLLHDACCCTKTSNYQLPYQCQLADCSFLHANTCREHRLIANCCCSDEYRSVLKSFKY